ncbi:hypothetical protein FYK55_10210 [Roseiconus nitratireducens]|uniref:SF4 helicase domain-containing protein n=1 Tax=Roseiconus nitratireducens TaxID=2605748 RepID=A0A5M6DBX9_9BACT|nr:DnaB-like helicase C-terminal domain-containing protein [Roseiconus nitratireducens]KAA5543579.1 hypothetical protein FYK55_10210 [Roseiconus nitratireducens]
MNYTPSEEMTRRTYFGIFDEALEKGAIPYDNGDGIQCSDPKISNFINNFDAAVGGASQFLTHWMEERSDKLGTAPYVFNGANLFDQVVADLVAEKRDKLFNCGVAFPSIEIGPGLMAVIGAPPGRGKTALAMQAVYDAVANESDLRAVVASLEVTPQTLLKRRLAMLAGVSFNAIRFNTLNDYQRDELSKLDGFRTVLERVGFLRPELSGLGDLEMMMKASNEPGLLLLDYVQLFGPMDATAADRGLATMATARRFCEAGWAVIAVSAVNRMSYSKSDISSFRDTSSIEYSGTSAYMLDEATEYDSDDDKPAIRPMKLRNVKNRNGPLRSIDVLFNGPQMLFSPAEVVNEYEGDFDDFNNGIDNPFAEASG